MNVGTGKELTVSRIADVLLQPKVLVPVIVNVVVVVALQLTEEPEVVFNPVAGAQLYADAPDTEIVAVLPKHIVGVAVVGLITGKGLTVIN